MKLPPQMIELFLRSSGAPPALLELYRMIEAQGFGAVKFAMAEPDDPTWQRIGVTPNRQQTGVWVRAESPNSRVTAAIFFEGESDAVVQKLRALSASASS